MCSVGDGNDVAIITHKQQSLENELRGHIECRRRRENSWHRHTRRHELEIYVVLTEKLKQLVRDACWQLAHRPLRRGSSASLKPSPKKFSAMTTLMMATPGTSAYHQYCKPLSAPCLIIAPHSAVGGTAPRPIKLRPAVSTIADPTSRVPLTIIGASVEGRMCRNKMRFLPAPTDLAAVTNSFSRIARTWLRIRRAYSGHRTNPTAMSALPSPGPPRTAVIDMARIIDGKLRMASAVRMMTESTAPPT